MLYDIIIPSTKIDSAFRAFYNETYEPLIKAHLQQDKEIKFYGKSGSINKIAMIHYTAYALWYWRKLLLNNTPFNTIRRSALFDSLNRKLFLLGVDLVELIASITPINPRAIQGIGYSAIGKTYRVGNKHVTPTLMTKSFWKNFDIPSIENTITNCTDTDNTVHVVRIPKTSDPVLDNPPVEEFTHQNENCVLSSNNLFYQIAKAKMVLVSGEADQTITTDKGNKTHTQTYIPTQVYPVNTPIAITLEKWPSSGEVLLGTFNRFIIANTDMVLSGGVVTITLPVVINPTDVIKLIYFV